MDDHAVAHRVLEKTMNASELISALQDYDPDSPVVFQLDHRTYALQDTRSLSCLHAHSTPRSEDLGVLVLDEQEDKRVQCSAQVILVALF
jgi:hypothetical protein